MVVPREKGARHENHGPGICWRVKYRGNVFGSPDDLDPAAAQDACDSEKMQESSLAPAVDENFHLARRIKLSFEERKIHEHGLKGGVTHARLDDELTPAR